jgi:hypothetical protein
LEILEIRLPSAHLGATVLVPELLEALCTTIV